MLTHGVQNETDRVNNGSQPTYNGKDKRNKTMRIPYIMQPEHEQVTASTLAGVGMRYYLSPTHQSAVVQRQFNNWKFDKEIYMNQIRAVLKEDYKDKTYEEIKELLGKMKSIDLVDGGDQQKLNAARLDILINLYDHLEAEKPDAEKEFTHYLMLERKEELPEGTEEGPKGTLNSEKTNLLSAIDCKVLDQSNMEEYRGALFIESFVSMASKEGLRLLRKVLNSASERGINKVVLGAYQGTEKYYTDIGFEKAGNCYSGEGRAEVMSEEDAIKFVKENFGDIDNKIECGVEHFLLYPIYHADIAVVLEKLNQRLSEVENLDSQRVWVTGGKPI